MNKLAKGFLAAFAVLAVLIVLGIIGIGLYFESAGFQKRLEGELGRALRMPVKLAEVHFSLWKGVRIVGFSIPADPSLPTQADAQAGPQADAIPALSGSASSFLEAPEISADIVWRQLFSHQAIVRGLVISSPVVNWSQNAKGKWELPQLPPAPRAAEQAAPAAPSEKTQVFRLELKVEQTRLENATFRFLDRTGKPLAVLEGVTIDCPDEVDPASTRGMARIARATLHESLLVENIVTPFSYVDGKLSLPEIEAQLAGGTIHGAYTLRPTSGGAPFTVDLALDEVSLARLLPELGVTPGQQTAGTLRGSLDLYGKSGVKKSVGGSGQLMLRGGKMEQYPIFQMIGQVLKIDELMRLDLQQAQLDLRVGNSSVYVDSLVLESTNLSLTASGKAGFDGKLDLNASLAVDEKIGRQLPDFMKSNFEPVPGTGRRAIHFKVGGTLDNPSNDLVRAVMGQKIGDQLEQQAGEVLRMFTGRGKKADKADKAEKKTPAPKTPVNATSNLPSPPSPLLPPGAPAGDAAPGSASTPAVPAPAASPLPEPGAPPASTPSPALPPGASSAPGPALVSPAPATAATSDSAASTPAP